MIRTIKTKRRSCVLTPSTLACLAGTPAVNLTSGCAHNCVYCYARGYSGYPGEGLVVIYQNTLDKLKIELAHRRTIPEFVYFSPSTDVFQPIPEVQNLCYSVFEFLLARGIGVAFLTKGIIPEGTMNLLLNHADKIRAQIGLITPDDSLRRMFEPDAAPVDIRLRQMERMAVHGIAVETRMMPVMPGITDTTEASSRLFRMIANAGIKRAAISTLFLRPAIAESLRRLGADNQAVEDMLGLYRNERRLAVHADRSSVVPLPQEERKRVYDRIRRAAQTHSIEISICGCMNPDIGGACNIGGEWTSKYKQAALFD